jgi:hypothetical protein
MAQPARTHPGLGADRVRFGEEAELVRRALFRAQSIPLSSGALLRSESPVSITRALRVPTLFRSDVVEAARASGSLSGALRGREKIIELS